MVHTGAPQEGLHHVPGRHQRYEGCIPGDQLAGTAVGARPHPSLPHQQLPALPVQLPGKQPTTCLFKVQIVPDYWPFPESGERLEFRIQTLLNMALAVLGYHI